MELPPGIRYLLRVLPAFFLPPAVVSAVLRLSQSYYTIVLPRWLAILLCALARPAVSVVSEYYSRYADRADAAARGADLSTEVYDKWPGGFSITAAMIKNHNTGYPGDVFETWRLEYGNTYFLRVIAENSICTFEPEHIKEILATQFENFEKGQALFDQLHSLFGLGVFTSDGAMWKFHRSLTRPYFTKERISDFDIFAKHADNALDLAQKRCSEGFPVDFQDLVLRFTLDSATDFLFGSDVGSLSTELPQPVAGPQARKAPQNTVRSNAVFDASVLGLHQFILRIFRGTHWPLFEFWSDKIKPHRAVVDRSIEPIVHEALRRHTLQKGRKDETESTTLLDHLIKHTEDTQVLKDELVNLLFAARDTTACTLTFAMFMLAQHPDVMRRLWEEILDTVGLSERPTYEHMRKMPYLRAFINETLRLFPAVPINTRVSKKATVWPPTTPGGRPIYVPAKTNVIYSVLVVQRRKDLWGPDALKFDPDRFLDERLQKYLTPNPSIFQPFGTGPRVCLGQQFGYQEISFFLVRLLQRFSRFHLAHEAQSPASRPPEQISEYANLKGVDKIWHSVHVNLYIKGGLWVRMDERAVESDAT